MTSLHRTQVYIGEEQIRRLRLEAQRARLGVSELIRTAIEHFLAARARGVDWESDPLARAIGKVKLAGRDASAEHDRYLYGRRKTR